MKSGPPGPFRRGTGFHVTQRSNFNLKIWFSPCCFKQRSQLAGHLRRLTVFLLKPISSCRIARVVGGCQAFHRRRSLRRGNGTPGGNLSNGEVRIGGDSYQGPPSFSRIQTNGVVLWTRSGWLLDAKFAFRDVSRIPRLLLLASIIVPSHSAEFDNITRRTIRDIIHTVRMYRL